MRRNLTQVNSNYQRQLVLAQQAAVRGRTLADTYPEAREPKASAPARDFSWYRGQVDAGVVRAIVRLKRDGKL